MAGLITILMALVDSYENYTTKSVNFAARSDRNSVQRPLTLKPDLILYFIFSSQSDPLRHLGGWILGDVSCCWVKFTLLSDAPWIQTPNNYNIDSPTVWVEGPSLIVRWPMIMTIKSFRRLISLTFLLLVVLVPAANAQLAVRGTVTDGETNQPFPGVTVSVRGTTLGTTTAEDGTYSLQVPVGDVTLVFSFVGYRSQEFNVSTSGEEINVVLQSDVLGLDEFVVVGSRRQPRLLKDSAVPVDVLGPIRFTFDGQYGCGRYGANTNPVL